LISRCSTMFYQKNSKASPEAQACGASEGSVLGERATGMRGHQDLALVPPVLFSEERRPRALRMRIREIAETRVRYGYLRIHILLRREGWCVNHKRVYRIYREEGLNLCRKRPRRDITGSRRMDRPKVECPNTCWSMDFVADSLFNGRRFRALTIVDNYSRECLTIEAGQSIKGQDVAAVIQRLVKERGVGLNMIVYTLSLTFSLNLSYGVKPNKVACGLL